MSLSLVEVSAPVLTANGVTSGGSLKPNTTYYYTIVAVTSRSLAYQYVTTDGRTVVWSKASNEVSITTDSTNLTADLQWTIPTELSSWTTGTYGFLVYRSETSGEYKEKLRYSSRASYPYLSNSILDDGSTAMDSIYYIPDGHPRLIIDTGDVVNEHDIYDWLVANGKSQFIDRRLDAYGDAESWNFKFSIYTHGQLLFTRNIILIHNGSIWGTSNCIVRFGDVNTIKDGNGASYTYNWVGEYWEIMGVFEPNGTKIMFQPLTNTTGVLHSTPAVYWHADTRIYADSVLWAEKFPGEMQQKTGGYIKDSVIQNYSGMMPSESFMMDNVTVKAGTYAFYGYYGGEFMGMRGVNFKKINSYAIVFHKNKIKGVMHAVNVTLPPEKEPPNAVYISRRENFAVLRKYEFTLKVLDEDKNPIVGASVTLKDSTGATVYSFNTDSNGDSFLAKGTATSGTTTTLTDTSQNWAVDELKEHIIDITGGTGKGQGAWIKSNTSDTITFYGDIRYALDSTSKYQVIAQPVKEKYSCEPAPATMDITDYNPFTLEIAKEGYETYNSKFQLDNKMDLTITLSPKTNSCLNKSFSKKIKL